MRTTMKHAFHSLFALFFVLLLLFSVGCSASTGGDEKTLPPNGTTENGPSAAQLGSPPAQPHASHAEDSPTSSSHSAESVSSLPTSATSVEAVGILNDSGVRLRSAPSTDSSIVTELSSGTVVAVFAQEDDWYKAGYDGQIGYIFSDLVTIHASTDSLSGYAVVMADALHLRSSASMDGSVVTTVSQNTYLTLMGFENGWFHVSDGSHSGYVSGDYASPCATKPSAEDSETSGSSGGDFSYSENSLPSGGTSSGGTSSGGSTSSGSTSGQAIADLAYSFLGCPYVYGGSSPSGFDCSGFIMYVYQEFGYSLPHGTNGQLGCGTPVDRSDLQPGDMVFFFDPAFGSGPTTHGGIYLGGGDFIHASTNGREEVQIHNLNSDSYYRSVFTAARRLVG